jgi:acyl-[acyl carrier protein]--UDP-N-acetylglucosamine O-acyltransferase
MTSTGDSIYNNDFINTDGNLIHKTAVIEEGVKLGTGNVIHPFVHIGAIGANKKAIGVGNVEIGNANEFYSYVKVSNNVKIGHGNIFMAQTNIGHDSTIGDQNTIGAQCNISGYVNIGDENKFSGSVSVANRKNIGNGNFFAMKCLVVKDVADNEKLMGVPAENF